MDIENYAKKGIIKGEKNLEEKIAQRIIEIKDISFESAKRIAQAAITEVNCALDAEGDILTSTKSGVTMGQFGVGSRGLGDFYAHEKIAEVIGDTNAIVDSSHLDDSGVIKNIGGDYIVLTVDGLHSRLSDYPFLSGFHVARASLRDVYVMGARPLALFSDIHIADDGDVAKIFDHIAGITTVSEITGIPLVTGSTLRIGGDMVIGERMTGGLGAIGITETLTSRVLTQEGDLILMTEGAGGGTISTTALYYGMHEVVEETINLKFIKACEALLKSDLINHIHSMTDVTNGGIRGDANEISRTANVGMVFYDEAIKDLINQKVFRMLRKLEIDHLGVSLDSLLITIPEKYAEDVIDLVQNAGVKIDIIGKVVHEKSSKIIIDGETKDFTPQFRESAYTPIKKAVGEDTPNNFSAMKEAVDIAAKEASNKKRKVVKKLKDEIVF
ncbi:AIR synthase-related protein [Methanosalsum natronophilum]|nr:AIR synthase-related protein [Methanosalsum natronophilum]MCS3924339.1 hydrogenase expression/formation protein [Methanosalsum natronophilum]